MLVAGVCRHTPDSCMIFVGLLSLSFSSSPIKNRCFEIVGGNFSQSVGRVRGLTSFRAMGQTKWEGQGFLYNCAQRSVDKTRCFEVVEGNYSQSDQTENYFFYNTIYTLMFSAMQSGGSFGRSRTTNGNLSKEQQLFLGDTCKPNCNF